MKPQSRGTGCVHCARPAQWGPYRGSNDAVAFGKLFIANPDLPARLAAGAPLNAPDPATFFAQGQGGYTDYPTLGS
jgi:2,4-dienoyl-CoA reductase-like NADH-dependent reductase (Old Yellow Enzyme family)